MTIEYTEQERGLGSFFGDLIGAVIGGGKDDEDTAQVKQYEQQLYYMQQELEAANAKARLSMISAGVLAITSIVLGIKAFKK